MKKILLICFIYLCSVSTFAQNVIVDGSVTFKIRNLGFNVDGTFYTSEIESDFSSPNISEWKLKGSVPIASIDTDNKKRDRHLMEAEYFNAASFPKMTLIAKSFDKIADNFYNVDIDLTIKGTTKSIRIPIRIEKTPTEENVYSYFKINRLDFGVGESSLVMSNTVKINVEYSLKYN